MKTADGIAKLISPKLRCPNKNNGVLYPTLENVTIIDNVLALKADAIANLKWFLAAPFTSSSLAKFGWVPFAACNALQRSRTENLRRMGKNSVSILSRLWTKVYQILG